MNRYEGEFEKWTPEMSAAFASKLTGFLAKRTMIGITIGADMEALVESFPGSVKTCKKETYRLAIKICMFEIGTLMEKYFPSHQVHMVHDHGNWDDQAVSAYNSLVDDPNWRYKEMFTGITSLTSKQSVGLQAADLIAFEAHVAIRRKISHNNHELRKAMKALEDKGVFVIGKYLDKNTAIAFRLAAEEDTGQIVTNID